MIRIRKFEWDTRNEHHILLKHNVTISEVEQIFYGDPYFRKGRDNKRYAFGQTGNGRYIFVVYVHKTPDIVRVITARDMTPAERKLYLKR